MLSSDDSSMMRLIAGSVVSIVLLVIVFKSADFRASKENIASGLIVGLVVLFGWYLSSNIQINMDDTSYSMGDYYEEWDMIADSDEGKPAQGRTLSPQSFILHFQS